MSDITPLIPRQGVPDLELPLAGGGSWTLSEDQPGAFSLLVFYRGWHCPVCHKQLKELQSMLGDFESRGVSVTAISVDPQERAEELKTSAGLDKLRIAYGLTLKQARQWGLWVSTSRGLTSIGIEEPVQFAEPGMFLVRPDMTLFFASVQSFPSVRPHLSELLTAIDFIADKDYPARGDVVNVD